MVLKTENDEELTMVETPWVIALGRGRYRLNNSPFPFYGLAPGDIVSAMYSTTEAISGTAKRLEFTKIIEKSENRLVRVIFENDALDSGPEMHHLETPKQMGCG